MTTEIPRLFNLPARRFHERMRAMIRLLALLPLFLLPVATAKEPAIPGDMAAYVTAADPSTGWSQQSKGNVAGCDYWHLKLTSQTWHDIPWEHDLVIFKPRDMEATDRIFLVNNGGSFRPATAIYGATLCAKTRTPVAILLGVPKQPLFDGLKEDDLIAETFVRFLATEDATWPLLFPMVKSVVRSMDAIGEFTEKEWGKKTSDFILSGASKRGWTTWLTAAVDSRVTAIAPMVIDVLNIREQLPLQVDRFGGPSEQIYPYTKRGLVPPAETPAGLKLWSIVDPWTYREKFTLPKLVVLGNNDPYWSTDALNLYWDGLPGEKYISYIPNAGHNLTETDVDGRTEPFPSRAIDNIAAFVRCQVSGKPLPKLGWKHGDTADGKFSLSITADQVPKQAQLWLAKSETKDFRKARWESRLLEVKGNEITATVDKPKTGYIAFYADLGYPVDELTLWLCTQIRLDGGK